MATGNLLCCDRICSSVFNGTSGHSLRMDSLMQQFMGQLTGPYGMGMMGPGSDPRFCTEGLQGSGSTGCPLKVTRRET